MKYYLPITYIVLFCGCVYNEEDDCDYYIDFTSYLEIDSNGYYHMTFLPDYTQTFTTLQIETGSVDVYQKIGCLSNKEILLGGHWTNLVNGNSYTDDEGMGYCVLGVWSQFIGDTISVYSGYSDECDNYYVDSLKVIVD